MTRFWLPALLNLCVWLFAMTFAMAMAMAMVMAAAIAMGSGVYCGAKCLVLMQSFGDLHGG